MLAVEDTFGYIQRNLHVQSENWEIYSLSNIFFLHIALLNLPLKYFPKFSVRINLQTYILLSLYMTI